MEKEKETKTEKKMCEYHMCTEPAKHLEATGDGRLVHLCTPHRRHLRKQKKIWYGDE